MSFSASFVLVIVLILVPNLLVVVEARALGKFEHGLLNREILPAAADSKYDSISSYKGCAVVLDVERSWSMFNVFCFDHNFDLVLYRDDSRRIYLPFYGKILFGMLRKYQDPKVAYHSLVPMDRFAEGSVPKELRPGTPIRVGATPELRWLEGNASEIMLQSVRDFLRDRSSLKFEANDVTILNGYQKGFYQWMTVNYLLGNSGKKYTETVGIVDMDDNSVQMVYAISKKDDDVAPIVSVPGEDPYIKEVLLNDTRYYFYVHSYLNYGLLAARAEILRLSDNSGVYKYRGEEYNASASSSGSSFEGCSAQVLKIFKFKEAFNKPYNCTFNGNNLYASSHFFSNARQAGLVNGTGSIAEVGAADFEKEGRRACKIKNTEDAKSAYPAMSWSQLPYLCMDLVYQYTLLVHGFGFNPRQEITLMNEYIDYRSRSVRTLWPLGSAIEAVFNIINPASQKVCISTLYGTKNASDDFLITRD